MWTDYLRSLVEARSASDTLSAFGIGRRHRERLGGSSVLKSRAASDPPLFPRVWSPHLRAAVAALALSAAIAACAAPGPLTDAALAPVPSPTGSNAGVVHATEIVAGTGTTGGDGDGGPATAAQLDHPVGMALGGDGSLYVAEYDGNRVRRIAPDGTIGTVVGAGTAGWSGDGGPAIEAQLFSPSDVAVGGDGTLYVVDDGTNRVRKVDTHGEISTIAGTGVAGDMGDGGPALTAALDIPWSIEVDGTRGLLISEEGGSLRRISPAGTITTIAGGGADQPGDGGPATAADLNDLTGMTVASDGRILVTDFRDCRVRAIELDGTISTVAGNGVCDRTGDGGPAAAASLLYPADVAIGPDGSIYVLEHCAQRCGWVRRIDPSGTITTFELDRQIINPLGLLIARDQLFVADRDGAQIVRTSLTP